MQASRAIRRLASPGGACLVWQSAAYILLLCFCNPVQRDRRSWLIQSPCVPWPCMYVGLDSYWYGHWLQPCPSPSGLFLQQSKFVFLLGPVSMIG